MALKPETALDLKTFSFKIHHRIVDFDVLPDRRVICPICGIIYKNINHHIQKSKCKIPNLEGFSEQLKDFLQIEFKEEIKRSQRERKAKFDAKMRKLNNDELKEKQRNWKAKSDANLRKLDENKFRRDRNEIKAKSNAKLRKLDENKLKKDRNEIKAKSDAKLRKLDENKFKKDRNEIKGNMHQF